MRARFFKGGHLVQARGIVFTLGGKGSGALVKELFLPAVEKGGVEFVFVAEIGNGYLIYKVAAKNGDLLFAGIILAVFRNIVFLL